ncbi:caspase family protein [Phycisphaeraceae bacterium D3-23]
MIDRLWMLGLACACGVSIGAAAQPAILDLEGDAADTSGQDVAAEQGAQQPEHSARRVVEAELSEGEFFDLYEIEVELGHHVIVNVRTSAFDAYLSVVSPAGEVTSNDDWNLTNTHSHVHLVAQEAGVWRVRVAGFDIHQQGPYRVDMFTGAESPDGSRPPMVERGVLEAGDDEVPGDPERYMDSYTLQGVAGEHLTIDLTSRVFDTFVILQQDATGQRWENDDFQSSQALSHLSQTLPADGDYTLIVTSFSAKETGGYDLLVQRGAPPPAPVADNQEEHEGALAADDEKREDGESFDAYTIEGLEGEEVTIDLRSSAFDTYVQLIQAGEGGRVWENDDFSAGTTDHSQLALTLPADGEYTVVASSYDRGEAGAYTLTIARVAPRDGELIEGELTADDATHRQGELIDWIDLPTEPGQVVEVDLQSEDFDTYLILQTPTGETVENDDYEGSASRSHATMDIQRLGVHRVGVTTFEPGMSGAYSVDIRITAADDPRAQRDISHLTHGDTINGELEFGDVTTDRGAMADRYSFDAELGQRVVIDLTSNAFDTFITVTAPDGETMVNDDFDGQGHSRLSFDAEQSGPYRLSVTSYGAGAVGDYRLGLSMMQRADVPVPDVPGRRVYGLFVGISDYGGMGDLPFCAQDAVKLHTAMRDGFGMRPEDAVLLTDQKATVAAVEAALKEIAQRASTDDVVVIFYSGHGGQVALDTFNAQDPDAMDETIVLVDGEMTDDAFSESLSAVRAGTQLVMLDACFSGGFAKDVVSRPGRMGLFSSEEDVLSMVADRFEAGGYLSMFVAEAMGEARETADLNSDKMLTALELCHYVSARYHEIVVQPKPIDQYVEPDTVDPSINLSFQKLVADRGGVSPNHVLLRWE